MKKAIIRFLGIVVALVVAFGPTLSLAANEAELKKSITAVESQIQSLQKRLAKLQEQLKELQNISVVALPDGVVWQPYAYKINTSTASGKKYKFSVSSGSLPPGLSLSANESCGDVPCSSASIELSGTPTKEGDYAFRIKSKQRGSEKKIETGYSLKIVGTSTPAVDLNASCPSWTFSTNLTLGSNSTDVVVLQKLLKAKGFYPGDITGYFGPGTKAALAAYQASKGVSPADGYLGPITRVILNAECAVSTNISSTLIMTGPSTPLRSQNHKKSSIDDVVVPVNIFNVKSEGADSKLLTVNAEVAGNGTLPTTLFLYGGSTLISSKTVSPGGIVTFDNLSLIIPKDSTTVLTITAGFSPFTADGSSASVVVKTVDYQSSNGTVLTAAGGPVIGASQYVYGATAKIAIASAPTASIVPDTNGKTVAITANFNLNVSADGGDVSQLIPSDFLIKLVGSGGQKYAPTSVSVTTIPNNDIADGASAIVNVTASWVSAALPAAGAYVAAIESIRWTVASSSAVTQTYGLEDFKTPNAIIVVAKSKGLGNQMANVFGALMSLFGF